MEETDNKKMTRRERLLNNVRTHFFFGLIVTVPVVITILVLIWLFNAVDGILQPVIRLFFGHDIPGIGLFITLLIVYFAGLFGSNIAGRRVIEFFESVLLHVPLVRTLYAPVKQVVENFSEAGKSKFLDVVMVEYPRKGTWSLAFVTSEMKNNNGKKMMSLLIPTAPNPLGGFVIVVSEDEVVPTHIRIEDAMKMMITCGAILPPEPDGSNPLINWPPVPGREIGTDSHKESPAIH